MSSLYVLILIALFFVVMAWAWWKDAKEDKARRVKEVQLKKEFLEKETVVYTIKFKLLNKKIKTYGTFKAEVEWFWDGYLFKTGKDKAHSTMGYYYKQGYFLDDAGKSYPTCNIEEVWVEQV